MKCLMKPYFLIGIMILLLFFVGCETDKKMLKAFEDGKPIKCSYYTIGTIHIVSNINWKYDKDNDIFWNSNGDYYDAYYCEK